MVPVHKEMIPSEVREVRSEFCVLICTIQGPQYYSLEARDKEEALREMRRAWERGHGTGRFEATVTRASVSEGACPQLELD